MENIIINNENKNSILEKISSIKIINIISNFINNKKRYIIPLFLSNLNPQFYTKIETESNLLLNSHDTEKNEKTEIKRLIILTKFYKNCCKEYKEYIKNKNAINDPIIEIYNKIDKSDSSILNYNKYFYNFLINVSHINLSPFCSLMNIIYFNEYYKKIKDNKKQKIVNLILCLNDEVAKSKINDLFGDIVLKPNDYVIKNKSINFNGENFIKIISKLYKLFNEPLKIVLNADNKNIKHNFKNKDTFIVDNILFKLLFKSNSLLIIYRV